MSEQPRFIPILPAHAIERCAATIIFDRPAQGSIIRSAVEKAYRDVPVWQRLQAAQQATAAGIAITVDTKTGKVSLGAPDGVFNYELSASASNLAIMPNIVAWQTGKYVRWKPFFGDLNSFAMPIVQSLLEYASINAVKLEYWDRFVWSGSQADMDPALLLRPDLTLVAPGVVEKGKVWHSHCGWFEAGQNGCRRLTNVNLDVVDAVVRPNEVARPSVGILTMLQDDYTTGAPERLLDVGQVQAKFESLHLALKSLLGSIISQEMAQRISLQSLEI